MSDTPPTRDEATPVEGGPDRLPDAARRRHRRRRRPAPRGARGPPRHAGRRGPRRLDPPPRRPRRTQHPALVPRPPERHPRPHDRPPRRRRHAARRPADQAVRPRPRARRPRGGPPPGPRDRAPRAASSPRSAASSPCFLAIGMATWAVRLPDGRTTPRSPAAPVLLRSCTLRATGAAQGDYQLDLGPELELNPVLVNYLALRAGHHARRGRPRGPGHVGTDLRPLPRLRGARRGLRRRPGLLGDPTPRRRHLLLRQAADGRRPRRPGRRPRRPRRRRRARGRPRRARARCASSATPGASTSTTRPATCSSSTPTAASRRPSRRCAPARTSSSTARPARASRRPSPTSSPPSPPTASASSSSPRSGPPSTPSSAGSTGSASATSCSTSTTARTDGARVARELVEGLDRLRGARPPTVRHADAAATATRVMAPAAARRSAAERLGAHVRALHDRRDPWGVTLHDVQEAVVGVRRRSPTPPRSRVRLRGATLAALDRGRGRATRPRGARPWRRWPTGTRDGADDPWFGAGIRSADEAVRGPRAGRAARTAAASTTPRVTLAEVFRGIQLPDAPTTRDWARGAGARSATCATPSRSSAPEVFDIPLGDLVAATGSSAYRRAIGVRASGWLDRWRLRRQARRPPAPGPPAGRPARRARRGERAAASRGASSPGPAVGPRSPSSSTVPGPRTPRSSTTSTWLDDAPPAQGDATATAPRPCSTSTSPPCAPGSPRSRRRAPARRRPRGDAPRSTSSRHPACGRSSTTCGPARVPAEPATSEVEWVWWSSLAEEIALRDPARRARTTVGRSPAPSASSPRPTGPSSGRTPTRVRAAVGRPGRRRRCATTPSRRRSCGPRAARARRLAPLRDLVPRCPDLVTAVRPCWVMSPLVVASVLPPGQWFDVVVFDEASQVPPAEAVSAISRARQVVVAGDSRQLPPTTFFTTVTDGDPAAVRRRRGDHRGRRVDPRRARRRAAEPPAVVALPLARRAAHRLRQRRRSTRARS